MKFISALILFFSYNVFAQKVVLECEPKTDLSERYEFTLDIEKGNLRNKTMLAIYNQGGLGPDNMEMSAIATEEKISISNRKVFIESTFPMNMSSNILATEDFKKAEGVIMFPNLIVEVECTRK
jgi:hypothetical protein